VLDGAANQVLRFILTGKGADGLYFSRDAIRLFVTNRSEGSISVLDAYTGAPIALWRRPGGGSPDMGNLTADGAQLWVSGRYNNVVYVLSTTDGTLLHTIKVGNEPHGLAVWRQPGAYSLGHMASPVDSRQRRANCDSQLAIWRIVFVAGAGPEKFAGDQRRPEFGSPISGGRAVSVSQPSTVREKRSG
jgi:hypothetical protein